MGNHFVISGGSDAIKADFLLVIVTALLPLFALLSRSQMRIELPGHLSPKERTKRMRDNATKRRQRQSFARAIVLFTKTSIFGQRAR